MRRRCQATIDEHTADWKVLVLDLVNCKMRELTMAMRIIVIMASKVSVHRINNQNAVSSH
jgi:hypothetical protein